MLRVGLTGGLGSGKSTVGAMLREMGAVVIEADRIAHDLMQPGQAVYHEVVRHFGRGILNEDGTIGRPKLAALAFGEERVQELNAIVHPAVIRHEDQWMDRLAASDPHAIAVVEAALIYEAGVAGRFDAMIVVTAPDDEKVERYVGRVLAGRDATGEERAALRSEALRRMKAQMPEAEKVAAADYVIDNAGSLVATREAVARVFDGLRRRAAERAREMRNAGAFDRSME